MTQQNTEAPEQGQGKGSQFSPTIPGFQLYWDSTSLGALKACPRKYYYSLILQSSVRQESAHLIFGLHYHKSLETYDHLRAEGHSHDSAVIGALRCALTISWGWQSDIPEKTRETLIRTVCWYLEQFATDPIETVRLANGKPAVELSFRFQVTEEEESIFLCGHLDRLGLWADQVYVLDRKTTKGALSPSYFQQYTPHNQFSLYTIAASVISGKPSAGLIVDAAQIGVNFSRFQRTPVPRTSDQNEEWLKDTLVHIDNAKRFAKDKYWPMNDTACSMYGGCPFRELCAKPPASRQVWEKTLLKPHPWNPLQVRGDI